jgi:hypothetical protein
MTDGQTQIPVPPPVQRVVDDYGPIGQGASQAHTVLAENGQEYIIKGATFVPQHPHVAANEYVAARLGHAIGLPVLDFTVVELAGDLFFASAAMPQGTFHTSTTEDLFQKCENRDRVYDLVVFDAWLRNTDRHHENLLVREIRPRGSPNVRFNLLCNDHSHCLVCPNEQATILAAHLDASPTVHASISYVFNAITDTAQLAAAIDRVNQVPESLVNGVFAEMPAAFIPAAQDGDLMREYLLQRRRRLATVLQTHRAVFPNLDEGQI